MRTLSILMTLLAAGVLCLGCAHTTLDWTKRAGAGKEDQMRQFIASHVEKIKPLQKEESLAWWDAATTGKSEEYTRTSELTLKIRRINSDPREFAFLKEMKASGQIVDPVLARQLDVLYRSYLENQMDPDLLKAIVNLSSQIEQKFSTFRGNIKGEKVTDNQIRDILKTATDSKRREQAWLASKQVGAAVAADLIRLVKLRNRAARKLASTTITRCPWPSASRTSMSWTTSSASCTS